MDAYRPDLAYIHDAGYVAPARAAAGVLLAELRARGFHSGRVVDLGCGSGILSAEAAARGFDVLGIDISPAMIDLARLRVPAGEFRAQPLLTAEIPPCIAVAAIGECFNYLFDPSNSDAALRALFRRVYTSLSPGGLFLFDLAEPGRVPGSGPRQAHALGDDWVVLVTTEEDRSRRRLTRSITSFRRVGDLYRRDDETHHLRLIPRSAILAPLRRLGFRVRVRRSYGSLRLGPGHVSFLARKPA